MRDYWCCSTFADWLRGTPKLKCGTSKEWHDWKVAARKAHPIRWWIAEEGLDYIENAWLYIPNRINDVRYYINNRWVAKTHSLNSNLSKGQWHEYEERLLHSMFDSLVDFVEIEQAWSHVCWGNEETRNKYKVPFWRKQWWTRWYQTWRCPQAGLDHLEWASTLTNEEWLEEDKKHLAVPTGQAATAIELVKLYKWWKEIRPLRPDPMDASGWSAVCEKRRVSHADDGFMWTDRTAAEKKESSKALKLSNKIEAQYDKEDEEMMIRLIKIRKGLWT